MIGILTSDISQSISEAAGAGITAIIIVLLFIWAIGIVFLMATTAIVTWTVKKVWYAGSNRKPKYQFRSNNGPCSPTGWTFNENTQLWEPPDYQK